MAKSIRSAIKKRFRSQKRSDRISVEDQRLARLSARLAARQKEQAAARAEEIPQSTHEPTEISDATDVIPMEVDQKKISTSGPRGSARETWKGGRYLAKKRAKSVLSDRQRKRKK